MTGSSQVDGWSRRTSSVCPHTHELGPSSPEARTTGSAVVERLIRTMKQHSTETPLSHAHFRQRACLDCEGGTTALDLRGEVGGSTLVPSLGPSC